MRRVFVGVLVVAAVAGVVAGQYRKAPLARGCEAEFEGRSRLVKAVDAVTDTIAFSGRGSFCPPPSEHRSADAASRAVHVG